jgi:proteasome lid subunit RPN8/RPN11
MGVMQDNAQTSDGAAASAPESSEPSRDADRIPANQWLRRAVSRGVTGRGKGFQVVFASGVVEDIRAHGVSSLEAEVCGVLVGNVYSDDRGPWCRVTANIRGNGAAGRNAQVTFTGETWAHINHLMDTRHPEERIVGWYHTHPGFGIFLSEMDLFIQENFFGEPWQIAYVDDPKGGDCGAFVWGKGAAVRRAHLIEPPSAAVQAAAAAAAIDDLATTARKRFDARERQHQRRRLLRRTLAAVALLAVLIVGFVLYRSVASRRRISGLVPVRWVSEKIMGRSDFSP